MQSNRKVTVRLEKILSTCAMPVAAIFSLVDKSNIVEKKWRKLQQQMGPPFAALTRRQ